MARLPELNDRAALSPDQHEAFDYLMATRGGVRGGFAMALASPQFTHRATHLGSYLRFDSPLPKSVKELASLVISSELDNPLEVNAHSRGSREAGVSEAAIEAARNKAPFSGDDEEALAINFTREISRNHKISQSTFDAARGRYGDHGVVDLMGIIGYYSLLAVLFVGLEAPVPAPVQ